MPDKLYLPPGYPDEAPEFQFGLERFRSPKHDCLAQTMKHVGRAQQEILLIVYGFTAQSLADLLIAQHQAGVRVRGVMDATQAAGHAQRAVYQGMLDAGLDWLIGHSPAGGIIHEKGICLDQERLIQGSYNWSASAAKQENHLDIFHSPDNARVFAAWFEDLYTHVASQRRQ